VNGGNERGEILEAVAPVCGERDRKGEVGAPRTSPKILWAVHMGRGNSPRRERIDSTASRGSYQRGRRVSFSTTSLPQGGWDEGGGYITIAPALVATYLPGRGRRAIKKARGLGQWPTLHLVGVLAYHLLKWESGRHNLC